MIALVILFSILFTIGFMTGPMVCSDFWLRVCERPGDHGGWLALHAAGTAFALVGLLVSIMELRG